MILDKIKKILTTINKKKEDKLIIKFAYEIDRIYFEKEMHPENKIITDNIKQENADISEIELNSKETIKINIQHKTEYIEEEGSAVVTVKIVSVLITNGKTETNLSDIYKTDIKRYKEIMEEIKNKTDYIIKKRTDSRMSRRKSGKSVY